MKIDFSHVYVIFFIGLGYFWKWHSTLSQQHAKFLLSGIKVNNND